MAVMRNPLTPTGLRRYTRRQCRHDRDAARAQVLRLEREIAELEKAARRRDARIHELEADAVDVSVERQQRLLADERADDYEHRYFALKARVDNEHAVTVPPMHRDVDEDEQATEPAGICVIPLREAFATRSA